MVSESMSTVTAMEPDAIENYVEQVTARLLPVLLARARTWERLGPVAPSPEELAGTITKHWMAKCKASADKATET